ncbi:MAG: hypothetical protein R3C12_18685 [Planctomycetaceae bacterium]
MNGSGGVVGGGSAAITTNITEYASGGVVVVQNRFANGYAYRLPLTIPADKVAADLHNFPVGVILQLSSSILSSQTVWEMCWIMKSEIRMKNSLVVLQGKFVSQPRQPVLCVFWGE